MEPLVAEAGPSLYGGYDLRRGDRDALFRYGGAVRGGSEPLPRSADHDPLLKVTWFNAANEALLDVTWPIEILPE